MAEQEEKFLERAENMLEQSKVLFAKTGQKSLHQRYFEYLTIQSLYSHLPGAPEVIKYSATLKKLSINHIG